MRALRTVAAVILTALAGGGAAAAQAPPLKIGVIFSYTGASGDAGRILDASLAAYLNAHGGTIAGRKVELIKRDDTGVAPDVARRLAQELIVQNNVDFLVGTIFTPNAIAVAAVSTQAKKPFFIVNAAGSGILAKAPYTARFGVTMAQLTIPLATWALRNNIKSVYSVIANYGPGIDGANYFAKTFVAGGGKMAGDVRVPVNSTEFAAYIQRVKDAKPDAVFVFVGAGQPSIAFFKAFKDAGLASTGMKVLATGDTLDEDALPAMGDEAVGVVSAMNYSIGHRSAANRAYVRAFGAADATVVPDWTGVAGYDILAAIAKIVEAQQGNADPDRSMEALKNLRLESPRGPIQIDGATRDIVQNISIFRTERRGGKLVNVELTTLPAVKDVDPLP